VALDRWRSAAGFVIDAAGNLYGTTLYRGNGSGLGEWENNRDTDVLKIISPQAHLCNPSRPSYAARAFAESRHAITSRRTCS
jgi:hypothetical protein